MRIAEEHKRKEEMLRLEKESKRQKEMEERRRKEMLAREQARKRREEELKKMEWEIKGRAHREDYTSKKSTRKAL